MLKPYNRNQSPLRSFRSFLLSPEFENPENSLSRLSLTYSNAIDPVVPLCYHDLHGMCNDSSCSMQHFNAITPEVIEIAEEIASAVSNTIGKDEGNDGLEKRSTLTKKNGPDHVRQIELILAKIHEKFPASTQTTSHGNLHQSSLGLPLDEKRTKFAESLLSMCANAVRASLESSEVHWVTSRMVPLWKKRQRDSESHDLDSEHNPNIQNKSRKKLRPLRLHESKLRLRKPKDSMKECAPMKCENDYVESTTQEENQGIAMSTRNKDQSPFTKDIDIKASTSSDESGESDDSNDLNEDIQEVLMLEKNGISVQIPQEIDVNYRKESRYWSVISKESRKEIEEPEVCFSILKYN